MAPNAPSPRPSPMSTSLNGLLAQLGQGERLIGAGGLLVLVLGDLLIGDLLGSGGIGITSVLATTTILVALYLRHSASAPLLSAQLYGVVLVVLVALVAVPALSDLLSTIHEGFGTTSGLTVLFDLVYWVGGALMAWGAFVHWRSAAQ